MLRRRQDVEACKRMVEWADYLKSHDDDVKKTLGNKGIVAVGKNRKRKKAGIFDDLDDLASFIPGAMLPTSPESVMPSLNSATTNATENDSGSSTVMETEQSQLLYAEL